MEMPITKPSMVSYADELDFSKLMKDLAKDHKNGFIRVTSRSEEGYILYKDGKQVAASYDRFSKIEALEKINSALGNKNTLIEVFDVGPSQVDYLLDLNKPYTIDEDSNVYDVIGELKKTATETPPEEELKPEVTESSIVESVNNSSEDSVSLEKVTEPPVVDEKVDLSLKEDSSSNEPIKEPEKDENVGSSQASVDVDESIERAPVEKADESSVADKLEKSLNEPLKEPEKGVGAESSPASVEMGGDDLPSAEKVAEPPVVDKKVEPSLNKIELAAESSEIPKADEIEEKPVDRSELLKKYGIKDVQDDDVENLLQSYKGGIIDDDDVERVELVLMNLIKKSVLGIPKIKGTEVMVFLDNYKELTGTINIITEYESQGFLNRIMGQSRTAVNLRRQIINIAEIAIKKSFRQYPEVVEKFEINVEFS
ncbi:DUF2226 domain-containing protein [Methanobacterium sp.]|uniref:DUF2226 domain-containing protein n=1 Tax=Methanobacterium sp. TaxID=2164 RepID=UPI002AB92E00|nr:DUF2226 domain-containing protein [Methanobacterium sp.]MDY9922635.1 DUF2226 domain-containing protein [Methanobacterium sp.]